jgi:acetyl esterase/lipase
LRPGIPVHLKRYESTIHPFVNLAGIIPAGREALAYGGQQLRAFFAAKDREQNPSEP